MRKYELKNLNLHETSIMYRKETELMAQKSCKFKRGKSVRMLIPMSSTIVVADKHKTHSKLVGDTLSLLITTKLKVLATFEFDKTLLLAYGTLKFKDNLLRGLGLFAENRLGLTTKTSLFHIVTSTALGVDTFLSLFVLGNLV